MVLFIIKNIGNDNGILLSKVRNKIKLAPSTVTPIITSLEEKGLIERKIDKKDRRNIYIYLSEKGQRFTENVNDRWRNSLKGYIDYIGEKDALEIIRLINQTKEYINYMKGESKNVKSTKIFKKTWISVIVIVALLCVQAAADLALPDYTSKIVNIGIQQGGIDTAIPEAISKDEMDNLLIFTMMIVKYWIVTN